MTTRRAVSTLLAVLLAAVLAAMVATSASAATATVSGRLVTPDGDPARRVLVVVRDYETSPPTVKALGLTDRRGSFSITGDFSEEIDLIVVGFPRFESGFVSCALTIVQRVGEACTTSPADLGDIIIERRR